MVAARSASSGVMPPCSSIHSSQCAPRPSRWPCAPSCTLTPGIAQLVRDARDAEVVVVLVRRHRPPARARVEDAPRHEARQPLVLPDVGRAGTSSSRPRCRRSRRSASACSRPCVCAPELQHVVVERRPPGSSARCRCGRRRTMVMLCWKSEPPSGTTIISSSRAASMICWRWSRRGWL